MATTLASTSTLTPTSSATSPSPSSPKNPESAPAHNANPVVAFIIGLSIILLASILNAAGLNLTKLDHVRTGAIPKTQRRRDWLRPLWLLGMLLYILSQLIGSTLALEYMRAEYVAPLGSTSLIFNFLFARFLVGTPVTNTDIYGTIIVVVGVIGIVAFGSINSGLASETDVDHITYLWRRPGWLGFFFCMSIALGVVGLGVARLDAILVDRGEDDVAVLEGDLPLGGGRGRAVPKAGSNTLFRKMRATWTRLMVWMGDALERWAASRGDKQVAWTLGIGWACLGGGLAGGCLVFAKATVGLLSGSISHQNPGNQFGHAAPIFTIILLCVTAVLQIICLNRGLKVYDSTLVVPVFYGIYTATGFLDSLIFNDQVDSYKFWTLFLIFVFMIILISGVVLLTHKKPERTPIPPGSASVHPILRSGTGGSMHRSRKRADGEEALHIGEDGNGEGGSGGDLWAIGEESDGEDESSPQQLHPGRGKVGSGSGRGRREEHIELIGFEEGAAEGRRSTSPDGKLQRRDDDRDPFRDEQDEFGEWEDAGIGPAKGPPLR